jgi:hypothetical protein
MRNLDRVVFNKPGMIKKRVFLLKKFYDFILHGAYLILLKNAINLDGNENTQTKTVTAAENSAING